MILTINNQRMKISFDNTKLKRNRLSLQSTTMHTLKSTRTMPKLHTKPQFFLTDINDTIKTIGKIPQISQQKQDIRPQHKFTFGEVELNISEQRTKRQRQSTSKFMRHFYYKSINRTIEHALLSVPPFVTELYEKEQIKKYETEGKKPIKQPVSFSQGFLKSINCAYYTIQNKIIFIKTEDLLNCTDSTLKNVSYFAHQVRNQVVNIVEIVGQTLLFPSCQLVLAVIHPWEIQFYAWQPSQLMKKGQLVNGDHVVGESGLKPLHFIYKLPIETVKHLDYSKDSRLFFFDNKGALHQITPHEQTRLLLLKTGRYSIRNYVNNSHNTFELLSKKHGKFSPVFNMAIKAHQLTKYLFPSKVDTLGLFYDRKRELLFGLLKKNTKLILGSENQMFIVCYSIKAQQSAYLLHTFSQQYFVQNYGNHMLSQIVNKFAFHSIHPAPYSYQNANLLIITKSGVRIVVQVSQDKISIVEVIRPPDYQMFQYNLSTTGSMNNYAPVSKNEYKLQSFYQDDDKAICTLSRDAGSILTYISSNGGFSGAFDINQQINSINMDIYREGSWNVKIYRVDQTKMMNFFIYPRLNKEVMDQLTTQAIQSAGLYLFMGESKTQLMSYLRPIDILFTCMTIIEKIKQRDTKRNRGGTIKLSAEQVLLKIFVNEDRNWSYIVNRSINIKELCAMLLQMVVDKSGIYYYCVDAAKEILAFCEEVYRKSKTQQNSKVNHFQHFSHYLPEEENHSINYSKQLNKKGKKINVNYFYSYSKITTKTKEQMKAIMQSLSQINVSAESEKNKNLSEKMDTNSNTFYDFPTASKDPVSTEKIILFRVSIAYKYISYLLEGVWDEDATDIDQKLSYILIQKLSYLEEYIKNEQNSMKNYDCHHNSVTNENLSFQIQQLLHSVCRTKQLLILLNNVTNIRPGYKFSALARLDPNEQTLQEIMFECIHKQYRYFIIHKWKSLFPTFISGQFLKLIALYGQIQQISNKETLLLQLQRNNIKAFPQYFIRYLTKVRKVSTQEMMMHLSIKLKDLEKKKQQTQYNFNKANDFEFSIPTRIKELSEKYRRQSISLGEADTQQILSICLNKDGSKQKQLTISNVQLLITYILKSFPSHPKIQYLSRCVSVQYELYRYYLKKIAQHKAQNQSRVKSIGINRLFKSQADEKKMIDNLQNPETMQLLRFHVLTDRQKIKKLVWASADLWVMADFCATFRDLDQLKVILRQACQQFESEKNRKFSSFSSYIEIFLLNIAIKSQYSVAFLALICQLVDEYLQSLSPVKKLLKEWVKFESISAITNKIFCLPQILIKVGYNPEVVLKVYLQQMQNIFDKNVPLQNQLIYGLKTLNSYILIDMYARDKGRELAKALNLQLNALQRVGNLKEGIKEGMKKLMDGLVEKI